MAPFFRSEAEEEWVRAKDSGTIPQSLFDLYRRANYLSFGTAPKFLADPDNLLFSYFCLSVRSVMAALVEASDYVIEFSQAQSETYYPGKDQDDHTWSKEKSDLADKRARTSFRNLLNSVHIAFDSLAEIIGIFAPGQINGLTVGRAQFSSIEDWLRKSPSKLKLIAEPKDVYLNELYVALHPIVISSGPESDWLHICVYLGTKPPTWDNRYFDKSDCQAEMGDTTRFFLGNGPTCGRIHEYI
jgi:hypothetical protein